uniref:Rho-GAP domain-containing protein n=1 Tax=Biomphalaria glabrata TaxID=6526 RepID=A0A2C9LE60_BIOGL
MEDFILINCVERIDHLYSFIYHNIRELGVKLPKVKKLNKLNQSRKSCSLSSQQQQGQGQDENYKRKIFGEPLNALPKCFLQNYGYVPEFLVQACNLIEQHLHCEGLFRKSGSVSRQKELKLAVDEGKSLDGANVFDTAVLIKQFFRELPEPLFVSVYLDAFIRCYQLPPDKDPKKALLQLCLLLPLENIAALRYTMHMLSKVAATCDKNKMTANNLALVMAPNMMHSNKGTQKMSSSEEKLLHTQTCIVELLIKNWEQIGMVSGSLQHQVSLMAECFGTDDDLDASDDNTLEESKEVSQKLRRKRSSSLTGFVNSIANGLAKLRRSTDGKGVNMSLNSTQRGELSHASSGNANQMQEMLTNTVTPCVMRKRRASGETVPFSASKKKAILGNLPQRSALASTPFTPASTAKKNQDNRLTLNITTPAMGGKTARKKLSLFTSPGKVKRESSESPPAMRSKSKSKKNIFKRLSGSRQEKVCDESVETLPRSVSSPTLLECSHKPDVCSVNQIDSIAGLSDGSKKKKKNLISEPSPIIVPVCVSALDLQPQNCEIRRSRRDEFEQKRKKLIQSVKESHNVDMNQSADSQLDPTLMEAVLPPPEGFADETVVNVNPGDDESEEVDVGSDLESEAGFSTISGGTVIDMRERGGYRKQAAHMNSSSSLISSVSRQITSSLNSLSSMDSLERLSHGKSSEFSDSHSICSDSVNIHGSDKSEEEEVWVRRKSASTSEKLNSFSSETALDAQQEIALPVYSSVSRKKSISAEDLQSTRMKVNVPTRAHSMYLSPCKKYNFKPHLEISKQTHNLLARAGFIQPTNCDAKDVPVPVKSPKRSSYREEMMLSLRSSFHERHTHNNISFRSLRALPNSSLTQDGMNRLNVQERTNMDNGQTAVTNTDKLVDHVENSPSLNVPDDGHQKDITGLEVDVTGLDDTVVRNELTDMEDEAILDVTCTQVDETTTISSSTMMDVTDTEKDVTDIEVDITGVEFHAIGTSDVDPMDTDTETGPKVESQACVKETNLLKIKRAEVLVQRHDSVLNIQHAGLVSQSIKQFSDQQSHNQHDHDLSGPSVSKRGKSPVRIPTIFAKNHNRTRHRVNAHMSRERTGNTSFQNFFPEKESTDGKEEEKNLFSVSQEEVSSEECYARSGSEVSPSKEPVARMQIDLSDSLMETINDICTPRAQRTRPGEPGQELKSPLKESTNQIQSALVASQKSGNAHENLKICSAMKTPHKISLPKELKPLQISSAARNQRPQIKRLRVQYSPRKVNHRSPKLNSPYRSPKTSVPKQH